MASQPSKSSEFKPGDWVRIKDAYDIPAIFRGGKPTEGRIECVADEGQFEIWVPIGDADVDEHSQAVFHPVQALEHR